MSTPVVMTIDMNNVYLIIYIGQVDFIKEKDKKLEGIKRNFTETNNRNAGPFLPAVRKQCKEHPGKSSVEIWSCIIAPSTQTKPMSFGYNKLLLHG